MRRQWWPDNVEVLPLETRLERTAKMLNFTRCSSDTVRPTLNAKWSSGFRCFARHSRRKLLPSVSEYGKSKWASSSFLTAAEITTTVRMNHQVLSGVPCSRIYPESTPLSFRPAEGTAQSNLVVHVLVAERPSNNDLIPFKYITRTF
jgi:hypothetical protein